MSAKPALLHTLKSTQGQVAYNRTQEFCELKPLPTVGVRGAWACWGFKAEAWLNIGPTAGEPLRGHIEEPCALPLLHTKSLYEQLQQSKDMRGRIKQLPLRHKHLIYPRVRYNIWHVLLWKAQKDATLEEGPRKTRDEQARKRSKVRWK